MSGSWPHCILISCTSVQPAPAQVGEPVRPVSHSSSGGTNNLPFPKKPSKLEIQAELIVFATCGRIRTSRSMPVLTAYFLMLSNGILGKGVLLLAPPLENTF